MVLVSMFVILDIMRLPRLGYSFPFCPPLSLFGLLPFLQELSVFNDRQCLIIEQQSIGLLWPLLKKSLRSISYTPSFVFSALLEIGLIIMIYKCQTSIYLMHLLSYISQNIIRLILGRLIDYIIQKQEILLVYSAEPQVGLYRSYVDSVG